MGRVFLVYLDGKKYSCKHCEAHLALADDILSKKGASPEMLLALKSNPVCMLMSMMIEWVRSIHKDGSSSLWLVNSFHCRYGKAYLFENVVNVTVGEKEDRMMMTGMHTVVDIFCVGCGAIVGWKYEAAHEKNQKYKVGKYILERFKVLGPDGSGYSLNQDTQMTVNDVDPEES